MKPAHERFRTAAESADLEGLLEPFAEDAILHSPVSFKPFEGKAEIRVLFAILVEVFEDFHYTDELASPDGRTHALIFRCRVGSKDVQGMDLLRLGEDGAIQDFTVMVRPRSAVEALMQAVGARLAAAAGD